LFAADSQRRIRPAASFISEEQEEAAGGGGNGGGSARRRERVDALQRAATLSSGGIEAEPADVTVGVAERFEGLPEPEEGAASRLFKASARLAAATAAIDEGADEAVGAAKGDGEGESSKAGAGETEGAAPVAEAGAAAHDVSAAEP
jgi:hypothetical protein